MKFLIYCRAEVERGLLVRGPYILISISDPDIRRPRIRVGKLCRKILRLRFHDAVPLPFAMPEGPKLMTRGQASLVWRFVNQHKGQVGTIVVHCEQGMSRSPAVAAAICRGLGQDDSRFFDEYQPNEFVYARVLTAAW